MINRDSSPKTQVDQQLRYALNVNPLREIGGLPVETGNALVATLLGTTVGSRVFNDRVSILFNHVNPTDDIIYKKDGDIYTILFRGDLGFSKESTVQCRIVPDSRNNLIAYFTDYNSPMKFINMNNPQTNIADMQYFVSSNTPLDIASVSISESGGAIPAGVWFAFIGLVDDNEIETNFLTSKPIYITDGDVDFNKYDGANGGTITNKAITINVTGIDTRFKYLRVVFCSRQAGVYQQGRQFDLRITDSSESFTFSGQETFVERTIEDVVAPKVFYEKVKSLAYNDNTLYLGNCVEGKDIGAQAYINNTTVTPINDIVTLNRLENSHKDANTLYIKTGFFNDEVAALYAVFNLKNGTKSAAYHIPGRAALTINGVGETMNWQQFQDENPTLYTALGGDEHKSISNNGLIYTTLDTNLLETNYPAGRMSYWENNTEFYPLTEDWLIKDTNGNQIGTLQGQNVRHHKFPSNRSPFNRFYNNVPNKSDNVFVVGFRVDFNLPQDIKDQIHSVEVYYARRDGNNARIKFQGTFHYMVNNPVGAPTRFMFNPARSIITPAGSSPGSVLNTIRVSSFDNLLLRPNKNTLNYFKLDVVLQNATRTVLNGSTLSENRQHLDGSLDTATVFQPLPTMSIKKIERSDYITNNAQFQVNGYDVPAVNNLQGEDTLIVKMVNPYSTVEYSQIFTNNLEAIPIITVYSYKQDVYKSFFQQELIFAGRSINLDSQNVFGGDCFVSKYTYRSTTGPEAGNVNYIKASYTFPSQASSNIWFRQGENSIAGMYFPRNDINEYTNRINVPDFIKYNTDFSTLNNLEVPVVFDPDFVERDMHLTRIHKTLPQGVERGNLRRLAQEDFIDLPTHRGQLIGIGTINGNLIPHMERGTFKTYGTQQLNTDANSIVVKSVDIFNVNPDEILETDLGYGGCQSINTIINTPHGAFWVDRAAGKIFLAGNGLDEVSANGLFNFFEDALRSRIEQTVFSLGGTLNTDTPSNEFGIHAWYDQKYRRVFINLKDYEFVNPSLYAGDYDPSTQYALGSIITIDGKLYQVIFNDDLTPVSDIPLNTTNVYGRPVDWSSNLFIKREFTAAYYPERKGWVFYSFSPYHALASEKEMLTFKDGIWKHDLGFMNFYGQYYPMIVELVLQHKQVANLQAIAIDFQNFETQPTNPTEIMVYNTRQNSGNIAISTLKNFGNIRYVNTYWLFNKIRDCVVDRNLPMFSGKDATDLEIPTNIDTNKKAHTKAFLNDTYHIVRLTYTPTEQKDVTLFGIQPQAEKSNRL